MSQKLSCWTCDPNKFQNRSERTPFAALHTVVESWKGPGCPLLGELSGIVEPCVGPEAAGCVIYRETTWVHVKSWGVMKLRRYRMRSVTIIDVS